MNSPVPAEFSLRPALPTDADWIAELRAVVMRPDLERLGRWDPVQVRERFLNAFQPKHTVVFLVEEQPAGVIAVRPAPEALWIEHFYIALQFQGQGLGAAVLQRVMGESKNHRPFRLNVLQGSPARRLYERHGFVLETEDPVDVFMVAA